MKLVTFVIWLLSIEANFAKAFHSHALARRGRSCRAPESCTAAGPPRQKYPRSGEHCTVHDHVRLRLLCDFRRRPLLPLWRMDRRAAGWKWHEQAPRSTREDRRTQAEARSAGLGSARIVARTSHCHWGGPRWPHGDAYNLEDGQNEWPRATEAVVAASRR